MRSTPTLARHVAGALSAAVAALWAAAVAAAPAPGTMRVAPGKPAPLVILVDTATEMPMSRFDHFQLVDGIHKDVGDALAHALGRQPRFLALPRKRLVMALQHGDADILCGYKPDWLIGSFEWSQPFMTQVEVVLTDRGAVRPPLVGALASQPIGTVFGYHYPQLEQELGSAFVRADAPSVELNLAKLAAGRLHHMSAILSWYEYRQRQGDVKVPLHPPLVVAVHHTRCVRSPASSLSMRELDAAIDKLVADGSMAAIEARYR